jgi:hypothetical protein
LRHIFGGFIAEHASADEYPSLSVFAAEMADGQFTDYYWTTRRVRYRRPAGALRPALELEVSWSPGSHTHRAAAINGRALTMPVLEIDGIDSDSVPFLNEPFTSVRSYFPWEDLGVACGDWPRAIGDRER